VKFGFCPKGVVERLKRSGNWPPKPGSGVFFRDDAEHSSIVAAVSKARSLRAEGESGVSEAALGGPAVQADLLCYSRAREWCGWFRVDRVRLAGSHHPGDRERAALTGIEKWCGTNEGGQTVNMLEDWICAVCREVNPSYSHSCRECGRVRA